MELTGGSVDACVIEKDVLGTYKELPFEGHMSSRRVKLSLAAAAKGSGTFG